MFPIVLSLMFKDECKLIKYAGMPVSHKQTKSRFVSIMVKYILLPGIFPVSRYQNKVTVTVLDSKIFTGKSKQHQLTFAPCLCEQLHTVYIHAQTVMQ